MCGITLKSRKHEYELEHLVVDEKYRHNGYAKVLIYVCAIFFTPTKHRLFTDLTLPVCAYANFGADNNRFYDSISVSKSVVHKKTMDLLRYVIDIDKLEREVGTL